MSDHAAVLAAMPWLRSLPPSTCAWLAAAVTEVRFAPGETLITQGAPDRDCYFLVSGEVEVVMGGRVAGRSGPGEPEGELALLYRQPRGGTVTALTPVRALLLRADDFDALAAADPAAARALADAIIDHLAARFGWRPPPWTPPPRPA